MAREPVPPPSFSWNGGLPIITSNCILYISFMGLWIKG